eukprot:72378_1
MLKIPPSSGVGKAVPTSSKKKTAKDLEAQGDEMVDTYAVMCRSRGRQADSLVLRHLRARCFRIDLAHISLDDDTLDGLLSLLRRFMGFISVQILNSNFTPEAFLEEANTNAGKLQTLSNKESERLKVGAKIMMEVTTFLSRCKTLKHLELVGLQFPSYKGLARVLKGYPTLQSVYIENCPIGDKPLLDVIRSLSSASVVHVKLSRCALTKKSGLPLGRFIMRQSIRRDDLQWKFGLRRRTAPSLDRAQKLGLTVLDLSDNRLGDEGVGELARTLTHDTWIAIVNLSNNRITNSGVHQLFLMLKENCTISSIDVSGNTDIDPKNIDRLQEILSDKVKQYTLITDPSKIVTLPTTAVQEFEGKIVLNRQSGKGGHIGSGKSKSKADLRRPSTAPNSKSATSTSRRPSMSRQKSKSSAPEKRPKTSTKTVQESRLEVTPGAGEKDESPKDVPKKRRTKRKRNRRKSKAQTDSLHSESESVSYESGSTSSRTSRHKRHSHSMGGLLGAVLEEVKKFQTVHQSMESRTRELELENIKLKHELANLRNEQARHVEASTHELDIPAMMDSLESSFSRLKTYVEGLEVRPSSSPTYSEFRDTHVPTYIAPQYVSRVHVGLAGAPVSSDIEESSYLMSSSLTGEDLVSLFKECAIVEELR